MGVIKTEKKTDVYFVNKEGKPLKKKDWEKEREAIMGMSPPSLSPRDKVKILKAGERLLNKWFKEVFLAEKLIDEQGQVSDKKLFDLYISNAAYKIESRFREEEISEAQSVKGKKPRTRDGVSPAKRKERNLKIREDFKNSRFRSSRSFALHHAREKTYGIGVTQLRNILREK